MVLLALSPHWAPAALAVVLFGAAWLAAGTTLGAVAQMTAPAWAQARALGVCQVSFFGAQAIGSAVWGWVGTRLDVPMALALCAATGAVAAGLVRPWRLSGFMPDRAKALAKKFVAMPLPRPEPPAPALTSLLHSDSGRVLEAVHYRVDLANREAFPSGSSALKVVAMAPFGQVSRRFEGS